MLVSVSGCLGPCTSFLKDDAFLCDASAGAYRPSLSLHQTSRSRSEALVAPPIMLISLDVYILCRRYTPYTFFLSCPPYGTRSLTWAAAVPVQLARLLCLTSY
jgi:hypothetical protein